MPVQNIECQIAQAQIGRYLSGDAFSPDMLQQLEAHIQTCDDCSRVLVEKRAALQSMLGGAVEPKQEVRTVTEPKQNPENSLIKALLAKSKISDAGPAAKAVVREPATKAIEAPKPIAWKPLMYSAALAIVLIGMSLLSKGPTSVFGDKVADVPLVTPKPVEKKVTPTPPVTSPKTESSSTETTIPAVTVNGAKAEARTLVPSTEKSQESTKPAQTGLAGSAPDTKPNVEAKKPAVTATVPVQPKVKISTDHAAAKPKPASAPKKETPVPAPAIAPKKTHPKTRQAKRHVAPARSHTGSLRVYDAQGNPISH